MLVAAIPLLGASGGCAGAGRDVVPESHDVVGDAGAGAPAPEGYEYVARRPLAIVALAEARGIDGPTARMAIEQLADRLQACVTGEAHKGAPGAAPPQGAARVVAQVGPDGTISGTSVRVDPGGPPQTAVFCLVAPVKQLVFVPSGNGARGLAVEAIWGTQQPATPPPTP